MHLFHGALDADGFLECDVRDGVLLRQHFRINTLVSSYEWAHDLAGDINRPSFL